MAKSLKEALLEKFSDLQELGIAPTNAPVEDEGPSVVVEMGPESRREGGGRRQRSNRPTGYDDDVARAGDLPTRQRTRPRRQERGGERTRPPEGRFRRGGERGGAEGGAPMLEGPPPLTPSPMGGRPPGPGPRGDRPPFGPRPPMGDRPRPVGRFNGPNEGGPPRPQPGVTDRLRHRAEQRRREEELDDQLRSAVAAVTGGDVETATFDKFLADLTHEVGALPPVDRVIEAVKLANSIEPFKVGQQIRQLYRRPRPRTAAVSG